MQKNLNGKPITLSLFREKIKNSCYFHSLLYQFDSLVIRQSKRTRFLTSYYFKGGGGWVGTPLSGTLYIPSFPIEVQPFETWLNRIPKTLARVKNNTQSCSIINSSASNMDINSNFIDYIFTDPPFGGNLMYSELNFLWEAWLKVFTNNKSEAIENKVQKKGLKEYQDLMTQCFEEYYRVLKPGRWMTVEFHNSKNAVWNAIQEAIQHAGFIIADVRTLDKKQGSFKQVTSSNATKQDLIISAYKPSTNLEEKFLLEARTEETAWNFTRKHLEQLPVFVAKDGQAEIIAERQHYLLFDRMVAFHVQREDI